MQVSIGSRRVAIAPAPENCKAYFAVNCCGAQGKAAPVYNDNVLDEACAPSRRKNGGKRTFSDTIGVTSSFSLTFGLAAWSTGANRFLHVCLHSANAGPSMHAENQLLPFKLLS